MVSLETAAEIASALPDVTEGTWYGNRTWFVRKKAFAWERPFSKADIKRFGDETPPAGPILALAVEDLGEKEAVIAANPTAFFTIEHFDGFPAVLVQLDAITAPELETAVEDAWLAVAPPSTAQAYLDERRS